ncbi:LuxR C-terminal-related transcriptional regulator [Gordonia sp. NPDC003422]
MTWPYRPDRQALEAIRQGVTGGRAVVLDGPAGIGKTTLARLACDRLRQDTLWVMGAQSAKTIPLSALSMALDHRLTDPAMAVQVLRAELDQSRRLLVVDDIQFLDGASAAVIAAILDSPERLTRSVVMTRRAGEPVAPPLSDALEDPRVQTVTLDSLGFDETTALIEEYLGGPVDVLTVQRVHVTSEGNPFYLRQLIRGALASGHLAEIADGRWVLSSDFVMTDEIREATAGALRAAPPKVLELLRFLSLMSPLSVEVLGLLGCAGVSYEPHAGEFLAVVADGRMRPAHPVLIEVVRDRMGAIERGHLAATLVDALGRVRLTRSERLHRAQICVDVGHPLPAEELVKCARHAHTLGDRALCERLSRAAMTAGADVQARLLLARTVSSMGRAQEADDLLAEVDPDSLAEMDLTVYAVATANNQLTYLDDAPAALELVEKFEPRIATPQLRLAVTAMRGSILMTTGKLVESLDFARAVLADPAATVWSDATAGFQAGEALYQLGRLDEALATADKALVDATAADPLISIAVRTTIAQGLYAAGRLEQAQRWSEKFFDATVGLPVEQAVACNALATIALAAGRIAEAQRFARSAIAGFAETDRSGLRCGSAYLLTMGCALRGEADDARRAADECRRLAGAGRNGSAVFGILADGFAHMAGGEITIPIARAREAVGVAAAEGRVVFAAQAAHWALRFGDREAASVVEEYARQCDGELMPVYAGYGRSIGDRDARAVEDVSAAFEALGYPTHAADALAQSITILIEDGRPREARRLRPRLAELCARCDGLITPAIRAAAFDAVLTIREQEVLAMVDAGLTRREIADRLGISIPTVDGHALRARDKVGGRGHA